jgi:hypothetical protein
VNAKQQIIAIAILVCLLISACGHAQRVGPTFTPTPTATATSAPTNAPTNTATSTPTATATLIPTRASTPIPTLTPTSTLAPTVTSTPKPKAFVIAEKHFAFYASECQTNSTRVQAIVYPKGLSFSDLGPEINGHYAVHCSGARHIWPGRMTFLGYTFDSDASHPLEFMVTTSGYLYLAGKGTVTYPDGSKVTFPR